MAITITEGCMDEVGNSTVCKHGLTQNNALVKDVVVSTRSSEEPFPFHRHCQKTVCSAYGNNGQGATWNIIDGLQLSNLPDDWKTYFTGCPIDNITTDLASILRLMNEVAAKSQSSYSLCFISNRNEEIASETLTDGVNTFTGFGRDVNLTIHGKQLHFNTMKSSDGDITDITLPTHSLTIQVNGATVKNIDNIVMNSDQTVNITIPEVTTPKFDKIYPVGSVYISVSSDFDPNVEFGPTVWQKFGQGKCLWGVENDNVGLDADVDWLLPQHTHDYTRVTIIDNSQYGGAGAGNLNLGSAGKTTPYPPNNDTHIGDDIVRPTSVGVIFWKRVS